MSSVKKGADLHLNIESLAYGGKGVARKDGFTIFVERTLPGQEVLARIVKKKKSFAEAYPLEYLKRADNEIEAPCPHFGTCGGCRIQNLTYEDQLKEKTAQVQDIMERIGGFRDLVVPRALASPKSFHYRNKMEFTFSSQPWRVNLEDEQSDFGLGLHIPTRFDKVLNIENCLLQDDRCNEILTFTGQWAREHGWQPYNLRSHEGWARNLMLRRGEHTGEIMVNLVTSTHDPALLDPYASEIKGRFPEVATLVNNVTSRKAGVSQGEQEFVLFGPGIIQDELQGFSFEIAANAFFQTNTLQAEILYRQALAAADLKGDEVVYDLYCGTGTITLFLAQNCKQAIGFELVREAVDNAKENARKLKVNNAQFILGDLKDLFHPEKERPDIPAPDIIVVDPPRAGLHPRVVKEIIALSPPKVVYVSCNPATLARDLQDLCEEQYRLTSIQPVDMFPHTAHIECVVSLELKQ